MKWLLFPACAALTLFCATPTLAQVPVDTAGTVRMWLTGRGQFQFNTTTVQDAPRTTFEARRVRLGAQVEIDDWIEGVLEADFAQGALAVKDAYMNLVFHRAFQVQTGQFKKPFSRLELFSSSRIYPIERGVRIRGASGLPEHYELLDENLYLGRELGAQVHGEVGPLGYALGIFNGTGADQRDENDEKSFAGRLNLSPAASLPLEIGAAVSYRELLEREPSGALTGLALDGFAYEADIAWGGFRHAGVNLMAEVMTGDNILLGQRMLGAQGVLTWFQPTRRTRVEGVEPLVRVSWGDPDTSTDDDAGLLVTPGVNVYFHGRNRFMLNWDLYALQPDLALFELSGGPRSASAVRAQMNLYF